MNFPPGVHPYWVSDTRIFIGAEAFPLEVLPHEFALIAMCIDAMSLDEFLIRARHHHVSAGRAEELFTALQPFFETEDALPPKRPLVVGVEGYVPLAEDILHALACTDVTLAVNLDDYPSAVATIKGINPDANIRIGMSGAHLVIRCENRVLSLSPSSVPIVLPVRVDSSAIIVGPLLGSSVAKSCAMCVDLWHSNSHPHWETARLQLAASRPVPYPSAQRAAVVATVVAAIGRWHRGIAWPLEEWHFHRDSLLPLVRVFTPHPSCPIGHPELDMQ